MRMKKFLSLIVVLVAAISAADATPFKALYVEVAAAPEGAGVVYVNPKSEEDAGYVYDQSEDWDETAFMKWVGGENSDGADYIGCSGHIGLFEVLILAQPEAGYEFVCLSNKVKEDGIYTEDDCYAVIHGESAAEGFTFDFDYTGIDKEGVKISVNNAEHPQDGHSSDGPSRDDVYLEFPQYMSDTPDTYVYAIFRKVGETLPKFEGSTNIRNTKADVENSPIYNILGQPVSQTYKGIAIRNGKKIYMK